MINTVQAIKKIEAIK